MKIKALSVRQPWAWLIANGYKTMEVRSWFTEYRGELLICAAKTFDENGYMYLLDNQYEVEEIRNIMLPPKDEFLRGYAVARCQLMNIGPYMPIHTIRTCCPHYAGYYAWRLASVTKIRPFRVKGKLGLFSVEKDAVL